MKQQIMESAKDSMNLMHLQVNFVKYVETARSDQPLEGNVHLVTFQVRFENTSPNIFTSTTAYTFQTKYFKVNKV